MLLPFVAQMETEGVKKSPMKEADFGPDFKTGRMFAHQSYSVPHQLGISLCASLLTLQLPTRQSCS